MADGVVSGRGLITKGRAVDEDLAAAGRYPMEGVDSGERVWYI